MELKEVLARVPGLEKRFVYYLEAQGYIRPAKVPKQRIARRDYSPEDLRIIREVWRYYRRGYSVQSAYERAMRAPRMRVYLALQVPPGARPALVNLLQDFTEVEEVSVVHGGLDLDLFLLASAPEEGDLYYTLLPALVAHTGGVPRVLPARRTVRTACEEGEKMLAYVMMRVPGKDVDRVLDALKELPGVLEASTVYGETDVIAKVQAPDPEALDELVIERIHAIPGVESTRTFIVIRRLHWTRREGEA